MYEENSFENKLRELRARKHWTQEDAAQHLGVSLHTYSNWETGKHIPSPKRRAQIAGLFRLKQEEADALFRAAGQVPPEIHNIPDLQNPFFTGRKAQLKRLKQLLEENGTVAVTQPVSISGLGGIGKTQLALEYAHRSYPNIYRAVFWVNAANKELLQHGYVSLAQLLELPEQHEDDVEQQVKAVKQWLERKTSWLLIMDNADDLQLARPYLPVKPGGHIVLTTRSQIVGTIGRRIEIEEMEPAEGLLFLLRRSGLVKDETEIATIPSDVHETAARLVKVLGGIPLALDQAGAYIEETEVSFADYIQLYEEARHSLLDRRGLSGSTDSDHPEAVAATFELCFRKVCEEHPMAEGMLFFYSEEARLGMAGEWFFKRPEILGLDTKSLNEVIAVLRRYSLVKHNTQEKTILMHPLVLTILRDTIAPDTKKYWIDHFLMADVEHLHHFSYNGVTYWFHIDNNLSPRIRGIPILTTKDSQN